MSSHLRPSLPEEDLEHVLEHTRELWEEARGQSFFITGGTGFFGMWLLETFVYANERLSLRARAVVLTRDPVAFAEKAPHLAARADLQFIQGDVSSFAFPSGHFAFVIHAATEASVKFNREAPQEMFEVIVQGTRRVLDFAAQAGTRKFLLTSSGAVYGRQPSELTHVTEDYSGAPDALQPSSAYGEGKRVAEHLCVVHALRKGYETKIARCFAFVGPHLPLDAHFAIGNFLGDVLRGGPIRVEGDGSVHRSYLYASDLAVWLWTILFRGVSARAYHVGSSESVSIAALAQTVSDISGRGIPITIAGQPMPGQRPSRYVPEVRRAEQELNLRQRVSLPEALRKTLVWHRARIK